MFSITKYNDRPRVSYGERINVSALIRAVIIEANKKFTSSAVKSLFNTRTVDGAENLKTLINEHFYQFKTLHIPQHDTSIMVDNIPSNLGCGHIFYFICSHCERRTKYLYQTQNDSMLACRICHKLRY